MYHLSSQQGARQRLRPGCRRGAGLGRGGERAAALWVEGIVGVQPYVEG